MLFDDPSSSSPMVGDARPAAIDPRPQRDPEPAARPQRRSALDPAAESWQRSASDASGDPRLIETAGAPEPEALSATTIASAVVRELYETGREVRFAFVPTRERVTVLLCDMDGVVLSRLTPARALEIATGEPVPGGRRR
jgi:hypothetical protein